ncbi:MAG TPA: GAF domain-containing protein, partial [Myxococcaceae bacterium]|nr:GAF domain-containing protein [Myxococcaceae bacterium]
MRGAFEASDTLVVIDEDAERRAKLAGQLSSPRRRVLTSTERDALSVLSSSVPDVAVTSIHAPEVGLDLLRKMRAAPTQVEAIVVTDAADESLVLDCLRQGAVDVLQLPRDAGRLLLSVEQALERRRLVESEALYQASRLILDARSPERLAAILGELLGRAVEADGVVLVVPTEADELLPILDSAHEPDPELAPSAARAALHSGPLVLGPNEAGNGPFAHRLLVPLRAGAHLLGVLSVGRHRADRPFRARDLQKASLLAAQAQLALENARLTTQLVRTERLAAMGELVAGVAHEINNPMSFVRSNLGYVSQALEAFPAARRAEITDLLEAMHDAEHGLDRILSLVQDLRVLGRVEAAALTPVNLREAVASALRVAGAELKLCEVTVDVPETLAARSDPGRLGQVLVNLLLNAANAL